MDLKKTCDIVPGLPSINIDENSLRIQADDVSNKIKVTSSNSDDKNTENPAKDQKLPQKIKKSNLLPTSPSVVHCSNNLKTDQDTVRVQTGEVSISSLSSDGKGIKNATKDGIHPLKRIKTFIKRELSLKRIKSTKEEPPLKRKKHNPVPISQMVMETIKALRKRNGASVEDILIYMEGQYKVNAKLIKRYVTRYLQSAVQKGILEKLNGVGDIERFKIRKTEKMAKVGHKLKINQKNTKAVKK